MGYECKIVKQSVQPVLVMRLKTSMMGMKKTLGSAFDTFAARFKELGIEPAGAPFVAYHNMNPFRMDIEVGFPVSGPSAETDQIRNSVLPAGDYAETTFTGSYSSIRPAYDALTKFVKSAGRQATGVAYEYYLNDPNTTSSQDLQTRIVFPLK